MPFETITPSKIMIMTENGLKELSPISISLENETSEPSELCGTISNQRHFESSFEIDKKQLKEFAKALQPKHGEKIEMECSCICDGTLVFAIKLIQELRKKGCVNIKVRSEYVQKPERPWEQTKFIATGILWNTNNWRKMHGLTMIRRRRKGNLK